MNSAARTLAPIFALALAFAVPACGGAAPPAPAAPAAPDGHEKGREKEHDHSHEKGEGHGHHGEEHAEHQHLSPQVKDLHETLAPVWHLPKGPERAAKTCEKALAMHDKSVVVQNAATPDLVKEHGKEAEWKAAVAEMVVSGKALVTECEKEGRPAVEERLTAFHERFHKVAEMLEHKH